MGGGGAMRAAAKVAGINVFSGGLRGGENPVTAAARKVARPVSSSISSDDVKLVASLHDDNKSDSSAVVQQTPYWEIDDWEFAGGDDVFPVEPVEKKMPRLLFGGVPTLEEAKEATSDLKEALEKTYLSPSANNYGLTGSFGASSERSSLVSEFDSEPIETKPVIASETAVTTLAPKHALQAFRFLNESPAAQTVVASIASDPNVWFAVLQNEALVQYIHSQKTDGAFSAVDATMNESFADSDSPKHVDESYDSKEPGLGSGIMDYFENIRVKVVDMMNSLSDTIMNLFGGPKGMESTAQSDDKTTFADKATGASFMGLAVMVIMVVMLKRV